MAAWQTDGNIAWLEEIKKPAPSSTNAWGTWSLKRDIHGDRPLASLGQVCARQIAKYAYTLHRDLLCTIPRDIGLLIWQEIVAAGEDSYQVWVEFVSVYASDLSFFCDKKKTRIRHLNISLEEFPAFQRHAAKGLPGLISVDVSYTSQSIDQFNTIADIPGLSALDISYTSVGPLTLDFLARAARNGVKLRDLHYIRARHLKNKKDMYKISKCLSSLPSLRFVDIDTMPEPWEIVEDTADMSFAQTWNKREEIHSQDVAISVKVSDSSLADLMPLSEKKSRLWKRPYLEKPLPPPLPPLRSTAKSSKPSVKIGKRSSGSAFEDICFNAPPGLRIEIRRK